MFTKYIIGFKYFDKEMEVFHNSTTIELDWILNKNKKIMFTTQDYRTMVIDMDFLAFVGCANIQYKWDTVKEKFILLE